MTNTTPVTVTPREFAERLGFKPNYGHQLQKDGRLVMAPDGKRVLLAESIERFKATSDPSKAGVAERHAAARDTAPAETPGSVADPHQQTEPDTPATAPGQYNYQDSKAKREHWAAEREHMAHRKEAGELIELTDHISALAALGALVRGKLEAWASILPPQLAQRDEAGVRATIAEQVELLLRDIADQANRAAGQMESD